MMLKIGGQLSRTKCKELIKTLPGYLQSYDKGKTPEQFLNSHLHMDFPGVLVLCAGKGCSFHKTTKFCMENSLPYEFANYGIQRWTPGQEEPVGSSSSIPAIWLENFVDAVDSWQTIEDAPLNVNHDIEDIARCAKHVLATGRLDKYELFKVWFKDYLPIQLPKFEWVE